MNRLIKADLKRIVVKPTVYIVGLIMVILVLTRTASDTSSDQVNFYKAFFNNVGLIFISIPIFLSVYSDEIKSGIMVSIIGMGMDRKKVVLSKLEDALVLYGVTYLLLYITALIKNAVSGLPVTPRQNAFLFLFCVFCVIRGIGIMALASLVLFLTFSASGGMLILIVAGAAGAGLLRYIQDNTSIPLYDISYIGLLDKAFADFQNGSFGVTLLPALAYLAAIIALNIITFDRKEMDL